MKYRGDYWRYLDKPQMRLSWRRPTHGPLSRMTWRLLPGGLSRSTRAKTSVFKDGYLPEAVRDVLFVDTVPITKVWDGVIPRQ